MTDDLYFNISEMKLSITYIISDISKYDIIWVENSDVIDSFIVIEVRIVGHSVLDCKKTLGRIIHTIIIIWLAYV